jgi:hypothetical protein
MLYTRWICEQYDQTEIQAYGEFSRIPSISELRASFFGITVAAFLPVFIYVHREGEHDSFSPEAI